MLTQMLYLARNGVPWSVIKAMSAERRIACCVALGEMDGGVFDWAAMDWASLPF